MKWLFTTFVEQNDMLVLCKMRAQNLSLILHRRKTCSKHYYQQGK